VIDTRDLACLAARAAASKQGEAVSVIDVRDLISITDYFVIVSGTSDRQIGTIADEVAKSLKQQGSSPARREGEPATGWMLLDFGDFVVHVFRAEERDFYRLENLWADAPAVDWEDHQDASSG
jgi:ribosome-associated protein